MTVRYSPEALEKVARDVYASRRLKNRYGEARCETCATPAELVLSGPLLEVLAAAWEHEEQHQGTHHITVREDTCTTTVS